METNTLNKCPVCDGRGIVSNGFYNTITGYGTTNSITPDKCRSCDGVGVIHAVPTPHHPKDKITFHINHNPDDWEVEVKDGCYTLTRKKPTTVDDVKLDYEVVEYQSSDGKIRWWSGTPNITKEFSIARVKRLSDNEIVSIGDFDSIFGKVTRMIVWKHTIKITYNDDMNCYNFLEVFKKKPTSTTVEDDGIHFWNHIKMKDDGTFVEAPKHEEKKKLALMNELKKCSDSPYYFMTKYYQVNGKPFQPTRSEEDFNMWIKLLTKQS